MSKSVAWMTAAVISLSGVVAHAQEEITARPVGESSEAAPTPTESKPATPDEFPRNAGWNSQWALHFALHNWLTNSSFLSGFGPLSRQLRQVTYRSNEKRCNLS